MPERWNRFWFADGDARNLAAARIIVSLQALWVLWSRDIPALSSIPEPFWYLPRQEVARRFLLFPGMSLFERGVEAAVAAALILVALGIGVRFAAVLAAIGLYHLAPLQTLIATVDPINRGFTIATLSLVVLAASPCADRWSLRRVRHETAEPWEYGWPLRLMWLFVADIYLFGALGKLRATGLDWFTATNLRRNLVLFSQMHPGASDPLTAALASRPALLQLAALGVLALEGLFLLAVVSHRARRILVPAAVTFHLLILHTMKIVFANLVHLGLFVNWGWIADGLSRLPRPAPATAATGPAPPPSSH